MKSKVKIPKTKSVSVPKNKQGTTNASSPSYPAKPMAKGKGKKAVK